MTSRISNPDTQADLLLRNCLDQRPFTSFVMVAGAGSGKTTSLVKALDYLGRSTGADLRRRGQQIACITYTEVAVGEIWGDVGNAPLFHVSTIHSFLWTLVRPFHQDLREWAMARIDEKIAEAHEKIAKPRTQQRTRDRLVHDIERLQEHRAALPAVSRFAYGAGSDYANGVFGHDDVLKIGPALIAEKPLLRILMAQRFPFVFVDESQDTDPTVVAALKTVSETVAEGFCLGFFGDPMQKIYMAGIGPIPTDNGWNQITKPENFRCPLSVLRVINQIRAEDDRIEQTRGRTTERDGQLVPVEGTARIFVLPADERRSERLREVRHWLATANNDPLWELDDEEAEVRVLVLVHRMAAMRLGFAGLYAALHDNAPSSLKDGLLDGTAWVLRPFLMYLLPLVLASQSNADFNVIAMLRANCPLFRKERLVTLNTVELLANLKTDVDRLVEMLNLDAAYSIREVLTFVRDRELANFDERFNRYLTEAVTVDTNEGNQEESSEDAAVTAFLDCSASQLWGYRTYIEDQSPFSTQQGIKGAEFQRVLVVLDDEEGSYNLFSYNKYFGITDMSDTDLQNISEGRDSVISRTRRLFYVCCSRAIRDLAVVIFVPDVGTATEAILSKGLFAPENVHAFAE